MLTSMKIMAEGGTVYATVVEKLDGFFKLRRNIIFDSTGETKQQERVLRATLLVSTT